VEGEHEFVVVVTTNIMLSSFAQILPWTTIRSVFKINLRSSELGNRFKKIEKSVEKALLKYPKSVKRSLFIGLTKKKMEAPNNGYTQAG
jgi:hypothetical protein